MTLAAAFPVRHVLAATDFSDGAEAALALAVRYAAAAHASVDVMHVFAPGEFNVTQLLADAVASVAPGVAVTVAARAETPPRRSCAMRRNIRSTSSCSRYWCVSSGDGGGACQATSWKHRATSSA